MGDVEEFRQLAGGDIFLKALVCVDEALCKVGLLLEGVECTELLVGSKPLERRLELNERPLGKQDLAPLTAWRRYSC